VGQCRWVCSIAELKLKVVVNQAVAVVIEIVAHLWRTKLLPDTLTFTEYTGLSTGCADAYIIAAWRAYPIIGEPVIDFAVTVIILVVAYFAPRKNLAFAMGNYSLFVAGRYSHGAMGNTSGTISACIAWQIARARHHGNALLTAH